MGQMLGELQKPLAPCADREAGAAKELTFEPSSRWRRKHTAVSYRADADWPESTGTRPLLDEPSAGAPGGLLNPRKRLWSGLMLWALWVGLNVFPC